jgi:hypothetical protein
VWLGLSRRFSKDYERLPETAEVMIYGAMSRLMVRRLRGRHEADLGSASCLPNSL